MLGYLLDKTKHIILTLRFSILSIFVSLFVLAMLTVIGVTYVRFSRTISHVSFQVMKQAATYVYKDVSEEIQDVSLECELAAQLIQVETVNSADPTELINYTAALMLIEARTLPSVQAAFWGDEKGSFVISEKDEQRNVNSESINHALKIPTHINIYRDSHGKVISIIRSKDHLYDPRVFPWYLAAKAEKKLVWTDVFSLHPNGYLGITAAIPVYSKSNQFKGVFALNVRLDYLRAFLESLKVSSHGVVFIVTGQGKLIAFPRLDQVRHSELADVSTLGQPWITASYNEYQKTKKTEFIFRYAGKNYLALYKMAPVVLSSHNWLIGVVAPEADFSNELMRTNVLSIIITLLILLIGIFLMSRLVNRIVNPMKKLVDETEKIRKFELEDSGRVESRIQEVIVLAEAIYSMKQGLRSFQKYVPSALVRQLVDSKHDVIIGGEKKKLAIFFSDIQDFTTICERMDASNLMAYLCEYLDEISTIVSHSQGTVDKYIGDSVMAFWGAPLSDELSCQHAARAALTCVKQLISFNKKWILQGGVPFHTRIGLHYDEVIVGNVGSNERINYTAIGDGINITSRLEGVNKVYGTQILTSDVFFQKIKNQFIFRFLDCVAVKGKVQGIKVYELLAEDKKDVPFDVEAYQVAFMRAYNEYLKQEWRSAIDLFANCIVIYPQDSVAQVFINRCGHFEKNAPSLDWDGIWRLYEK